MARPTKDDADKAIHTMLPKRVLDLVDAANREETFAKPELLAKRFPDWIDKGVSSRQIATLRREWITRIIEERLSNEARYPTRIRVIAPVAGDPAEVQEAADWMRDQEAFLNREPPAAIRNAIELNKFRLSRDTRDETGQ